MSPGGVVLPRPARETGHERPDRANRLEPGGTCASVALLLAPFSRSRRTSGSLDDPSGFSTLTTHTEGLRAWAISAFLGAAIALGALLVGWFFTTRDRPTAQVRGSYR